MFRVFSEDSAHGETRREPLRAITRAQDMHAHSGPLRGFGNEAVITDMVPAFADQQMIRKPERSHASFGVGETRKRRPATPCSGSSGKSEGVIA